MHEIKPVFVFDWAQLIFSTCPTRYFTNWRDFTGYLPNWKKEIIRNLLLSESVIEFMSEICHKFWWTQTELNWTQKSFFMVVFWFFAISSFFKSVIKLTNHWLCTKKVKLIWDFPYLNVLKILKVQFGYFPNLGP